jgi:hypothetical protein
MIDGPPPSRPPRLPRGGRPWVLRLCEFPGETVPAIWISLFPRHNIAPSDELVATLLVGNSDGRRDSFDTRFCRIPKARSPARRDWGGLWPGRSLRVAKMGLARIGTIRSSPIPAPDPRTSPLCPQLFRGSSSRSCKLDHRADLDFPGGEIPCASASIVIGVQHPGRLGRLRARAAEALGRDDFCWSFSKTEGC